MIKYIDTDVGFIKNIFNWCSRNKLLRVWFTSVKKEIFRFLFLNLLHIVEIVFIILAWFLEDTCNTQYTVIHFCRCFGGQIKTESVIVKNIVTNMSGYRPPHGSLLYSCFHHTRIGAEFLAMRNIPSLGLSEWTLQTFL